MITVDRAGYGASSPLPDDVLPTITGYAEDPTRRSRGSQNNLAMREAMRDDPLGATAQLAQALAPMAAGPTAQVGALAIGPADEAVLATDPSRRAQLETMLVEGFAAGSLGLAADLVSYTLAPWGFELTTVRCPTAAFYGAYDPVVSPEHGEWYANGVQAGALHVTPGVGHLVAVPAWEEILGALR